MLDRLLAKLGLYRLNAREIYLIRTFRIARIRSFVSAASVSLSDWSRARLTEMLAYSDVGCVDDPPRTPGSDKSMN